MKVLFLEFLPNVGHIGDIKEVNDSYARNFLIPKGFVKKLDKNEEKNIKEKEKKEEQERRNLVENKHKIIEKLNGQTLSFKAKTSDNGKMFGGIGEQDIIKKILKKFKIKLEKKNVDLLDGHIKKLGKKDIYIKLGEDMAKITIIVE